MPCVGLGPAGRVSSTRLGLVMKQRVRHVWDSSSHDSQRSTPNRGWESVGGPLEVAPSFPDLPKGDNGRVLLIARHATRACQLSAFLACNFKDGGYQHLPAPIVNCSTGPATQRESKAKSSTPIVSAQWAVAHRGVCFVPPFIIYRSAHCTTSSPKQLRTSAQETRDKYQPTLSSNGSRTAIADQTACVATRPAVWPSVCGLRRSNRACFAWQTPNVEAQNIVQVRGYHSPNVIYCN